MKNTWKRVCVFGAGAALIIGASSITSGVKNKASAYFTDHEAVERKTVPVGNMNIVAENAGNVLKDDGSDYTASDRFLPGDTLKYSYNVYRTGDIDADAAEIVKLTVMPGTYTTDDGKTETGVLTADDAKYFSITKADGTEISTDAPLVNVSMDGVNLVKTYILNTNTNASASDYNSTAPIGTASQTDPDKATNRYLIEFDRNAGMGSGTDTDDWRDAHLMGCSVNVDMDVYAVQEKNKAADSDITFKDGKLNFGGDYSVFAK